MLGIGLRKPLRHHFVLMWRWMTVRGCTVFVCNQPPIPTQPPTLSWMGDDYRPRRGDALQLQDVKQSNYILWIKRMCSMWNFVSPQCLFYLTWLWGNFERLGGKLWGQTLPSHPIRGPRERPKLPQQGPGGSRPRTTLKPWNILKYLVLTFSWLFEKWKIVIIVFFSFFCNFDY